MWGDPLAAATLNQPIRINNNPNNNQDNTPFNSNGNNTNNSSSNNNTSIQDISTNTLNAKQKKCSFSIYQITGPAHIPTTDVRWQELFLSYDILVHLDRGQISSSSSSSNSTSSSSTSTTTSMMDQVCKSMTKHARNSSNLAGFTWHLTKMMNEFIHGVKECCASSAVASPTASASGGGVANNNNGNHNGDMNTHKTGGNTNSNTTPTSSAALTPSVAATGFSNATTARIAMVGKARVVCGALNLFRILCHEVITASFMEEDTIPDFSSDPPPFSAPEQSTNNNSNNSNSNNNSSSSNPQETTTSYEFLQEAFTYKSRQKDIGMDIDTSSQLASTLLSFISMVGVGANGGGQPTQGEPNAAGAGASSTVAMDLLRTVPELYDATVLCLLLLNVLFSTQLYQPLLSSFELREDIQNGASANGGSGSNTNATYKKNFFLDIVMQQAFENRLKMNSKYQQRQNNSCHTWTSQSILASCLHWTIERPAPPERSIAYHFRDMVSSVARDVKGEKVGPDGMYENHAIVMASAPVMDEGKDGTGGVGSPRADGSGSGGSSRPSNGGRSLTRRRSTPNMLYDATNKVVRISSSLFLLPFRLMILALRAIGDSHLLGSTNGGSGEGFDHSKLAQLQAAYGLGGIGGSNDSTASPTNDVLWLSDSPVADLGSSIFLILSNNYRASSPTDSGDLDNIAADHHFVNNAFRSDLASLDDNRWDGWNSSYSLNGNAFLDDTTNAFESVDLNHSNGSSDRNHGQNVKQKRLLTTNFEHLFQSFGKTLHNELGALTLYTLLQSSPIFAASLAVRSDLDMLVIPLLRTLYFSSSINQHIAGRTTTASTKTTPSGEKIANSSSTSVTVSEHPFRSQSQLYVVMILLLIFSQDTSFGPDSFRRSNIPVVIWYKERRLKNISLGSLIVLSLLRCISFNLNRMQDPFLLSNCCAVLLNLSPHVVNLHSYAATRLASVLVSSMKRYTVLVMKNGGRPAKEGDVSSVLGMYSETCRILLQVVKHGVRRRVVEKNLHLVYALVYHQRDFSTILKAKKSPFRPADTEKITAMIKKADGLIAESSARTAEKTMEVLKKSTDILKGSKVRKSNSSISADDSTISTTSSSTVSGMEDFRFTYEEEADPEIFFVPYLWEIIVSCVTASSLEWNKKKIKVFALLEHCEGDIADSQENISNQTYAKDLADVV